MQDKIPDALIAAFERHYDADWNLNQLRNERLVWRAAWAEATKPCLHQITEPQAAPEAAAVPDEREAFEKWASFVGYNIKRWQADANLYEDNGTEDAWIAWQARAALAATPAAAARLSRAEAAITIRNLKREIAEKEAAAPVVLPEPDAYMDSEDAHRVGTSSDWVVTGDRRAPDDVALYTASTVRVLLATATGLPAQAVPAFCHVASLKLKNLQERGYQITGYAIEKPVEGAQPERGFINHGGFVGWWWDGQSPQAQADARNAEITWPKARDVGRIGDMSQVAHIRVGFDSDNDVLVSVWDENGGGSIEFCNPGGGGGGQSSRTRMALIALMVAMEADNTEKPSRDWWAQRAALAAANGESQ